MDIMEPCNYVSNIAYYHSALRICKYPAFAADNTTQNALKRGFVTLTAGSAFMHGTHTNLGALYDNTLIGVIAYTSWRSLLGNLGGNSTVLNCLSTNATCIPADELSEKFAFFSSEQPVDNWVQTMNDLMMLYPWEYYYTFAALVVTIFYATLPEKVATTLINGAMNATLPPEVRTFFIDHFNPEIIPLVSKLPIGILDSVDILTRMGGMLVKILWAFLWQEQFLTPKVFLKPISRHIGASLSPWVMGVGSAIDRIPQTSEYMITGEHVYPGWEYCNIHSDHSLWHQLSADGLTDLVLVIDYVQGKLSP